MTASLQLVLDTTAPQLTWGTVSGAVAGEELAVGYSLTEPGVQAVTATLRDGRVLAMSDDGRAFRVVLPNDTPDGYVTVTATLRDDVWNTRTAALQVLVTGGVAPVTPPVPVGGPGSPARAPGRLIRSDASSARCASGYGATAVASTSSAAHLSAIYTAPSRRVLDWWTPLVTSSTGSTRSIVANIATATGRSEWTTTKRPEGPNAEDELAVLLLL